MQQLKNYRQMPKTSDLTKSPQVCAQLAQDKARAAALLLQLRNSRTVYVTSGRPIRVN